MFYTLQPPKVEQMLEKILLCNNIKKETSNSRWCRLNRTFADRMACEAFLGSCNYARLLPSSVSRWGVPETEPKPHWLAIYVLLSWTGILAVTTPSIDQLNLIFYVVYVLFQIV